MIVSPFFLISTLIIKLNQHRQAGTEIFTIVERVRGLIVSYTQNGNYCEAPIEKKTHTEVEL